MKAKNILSLIKNNPESVLIILSQPYETNAFNECYVVNHYKAGEKVFEDGEDFSDVIDCNTGVALVDLIILS